MTLAAGIIAQEEIVSQGEPTFNDVVLEVVFDAPAGSTFTDDQSNVDAMLQFHNGAILSAGADFMVTPLYGSATSLRCSAAGDNVSAPANPLYQFGGSDFTVEFWFQLTATPDRPMQWIGVWDETDLSKRSWRWVTDADRWHFQFMQGGQLIDFTGVNASNTPGLWQYFALVRYRGFFRVFYSNQFFSSGRIDRPSIAMPGRIDNPLTPTPLRIGGSNGVLGVNGYMQGVRITRGAWPWYRDDADPAFPNPVREVPWGVLRPSLVIDSDTFQTPQLGGILPRLFVDTDTIYAPRVKYTQTLFPSRVDDSLNDDFHVVPGGLIGPTPPFVIGGDHPRIVNALITDSGGAFRTSGTLALPPSLVAGNMLIAFIQTKVLLQTITLDGPLGWSFHPENSMASKCGNAVVAWRIVDGTQADPTFRWGSPSLWTGQVIQIENDDSNFPLVQTVTECGGGARIRTAKQIRSSNRNNLGVAFLYADNNQLIPTPPFFRPFSQHNGSAGSNLVCYQEEAPNDRAVGKIDMAIPLPANWGLFEMGIQAPA